MTSVAPPTLASAKFAQLFENAVWWPLTSTVTCSPSKIRLAYGEPTACELGHITCQKSRRSGVLCELLGYQPFFKPMSWVK